MTAKDAHDRGAPIRALELLVVLPLFAWIAFDLRPARRPNTRAS